MILSRRTILFILPTLLSAAKNPANKLILQVEKKVHEALPTKDEKAFDQIGWSRSILDAERLAKQSRRPIVLFTGDGNINTGRCCGGSFAARAGPLSDRKVIGLLNKYFVSVYTANEDTSPTGSAPADEKAELLRIYNEYAVKKLPFGNVHFYVLTPDATPLDGVSVNGLTVELFSAMLEKAVRDLQLAPGEPIVKPRPQSTPPAHPPDSLVFHLIARGAHTGSYREYPSENWIILSRDEGASILSAGAVKPGFSWEIEKNITAKLLVKFYPQSVEISTAERARIEESLLKATVVSVEGDVTYVRLDGNLIMKRSFTPGADDNNFVRATLLGFITFDAKSRAIQTLRLVTTKAIYGVGPSGDDGAPSNDEEFSAVLRSMSPDALQQYLGAR